MVDQLLVIILYHPEGLQNFQYYYKYAVEIKYKDLFKDFLCYDRFVHKTYAMIVSEA